MMRLAFVVSNVGASAKRILRCDQPPAGIVLKGGDCTERIFDRGEVSETVVGKSGCLVRGISNLGQFAYLIVLVAGHVSVGVLLALKIAACVVRKRGCVAEGIFKRGESLGRHSGPSTLWAIP